MTPPDFKLLSHVHAHESVPILNHTHQTLLILFADCAEGTWGIDCVGICDCLTADTVCDPINGCEACSPGFQGGSCDERIPCTPAVTDCGTGSTCQENGDIFTCECDENYERNLTTFGCDGK